MNVRHQNGQTHSNNSSAICRNVTFCISEVVFGTLPNIYDQAFCENRKRPKAVNYF